MEHKNWTPRAELAAFIEGLGTRDEEKVDIAVYVTMTLLNLPFYPRFPVYNFYWGSTGPSSAGVSLDLEDLNRESLNWKDVEHCYKYFKVGQLLSKHNDELLVLAKYLWGNGKWLKAGEAKKAKRIITNIKREASKSNIK